MAESAVNFLLNHLSVWLQEERNLLGGLKDELQIIRDVLQQMRAFLRVADAREESDPQLKQWVSLVREIAYDIEDVLESYMLESCASHLSHGISGYIERLICSPIKKLKAKHDVAYEIKALRYRAKSALKTFRDLNGVFPGSSPKGVTTDTWYDGRGDALLLEKADVVGIERPKRQLLKWISTSTKPDNALKVISVVGMAGLGKTTLVKKVYDDSSAKKDIDHHVWINVSKTYKVENLLQDLIMQLLDEVKQALPSRWERMNTDEMREYIYNFLQHKKYIIVLDDVWSANVWEALRYAFPRSNTDGCGHIIVTTRFRTIGDSACCESRGHVYNLQPLTPQKAKELFRRKAFHGAHSCPPHLTDISDNILKRCGGLPLAIVVIGGVLATKRNKIEEWTKFNHNLGYELEGDKRVWKVLSLSYYDLPYYLKACLLYLSIFPEGYLLEKATIIRLWTAEGFVETKEGKTMEEIADGYLNELCNRSMIQIAKITKDGRRPKKYCIHDLVREYIISKARDQNLVVVKCERGITWDNRIRHLALVDCFSNNIEQINNFKCLRTLLFFGSVDLEWRSILCNVLHGGGRMLKELDLRGAPLDTIPDEVFTLYGLKYLCLRDTRISSIPKLIGNLEKLETLDLKGSEVVELPVEILKLQRLRYLSVYKYDSPTPYLRFHSTQSFKAPYEIGQLLHLQKLCYIDASANMKGHEIVKEIGRLTELRRLSIVKLRQEDGKDLCSSLTNLRYLSTLIISSVKEDEVIDFDYHIPSTCLKYLRLLILRGRLESVPQWIPSLNALTTLKLRWSNMVDDDPLKNIQDLPNLQILEMDCAYQGEGLMFKSGSFLRLTQLDIGRMKRLKWMRVEKGSMPSLKSFVILDCKVLMELSAMGIEHLRNLVHVGFIDMAEGFVKKLIEEKKREGKGWKLAHVPAVVVAHWADGELKYRRV